MKKLIFALFIVSSFYSNAQGVHGGFSGGSQLLKIEAGYSLNENIHVGGYYSLGMDLNAIPLPSSYGVYGRYSFEKSDLFSNDSTFFWCSKHVPHCVEDLMIHCTYFCILV